jgi:hypothetical protein
MICLQVGKSAAELCCAAANSVDKAVLEKMISVKNKNILFMSDIFTLISG